MVPRYCTRAEMFRAYRGVYTIVLHWFTFIFKRYNGFRLYPRNFEKTLMISVSHRTCNGRCNSSRGDSPRHTDGMLRGHRSTNESTLTVLRFQMNSYTCKWRFIFTTSIWDWHYLYTIKVLQDISCCYIIIVANIKLKQTWVSFIRILWKRGKTTKNYGFL